ncbi:MAG: glycosyltransferase family 4 protein [Candidatus Aenigmarchaeota archaeon]|nr:glycosyltransferase family 4 protein [Candidatus Aenigmarchaeota archaeon]
MKVLMFGWEFPPYTTGGLGTHCYNLTRALSGRNVKVTFVMPKVSGGVSHNFVKIVHADDAKFIEIASGLTPYVSSIAGHYTPGKEGASSLYGSDFFEKVNQYTECASVAVMKEECDVIHCHDWMTFPAGIRVKKDKGKPLVITVHSTEYDRNPVSPNQWISHIEWEGMYNADRIIAVSEYMKARIIERFKVPASKIEIVYNAVEASEYAGSRLRFGTGEKIVLFLGRLALQKGPDYFLRAAKLVIEKEKKTRFIIVGTGNMLPELIDQCIELGISENVIFAGYQESIKEYYKMADVYVMPSVSEPFGITALEAIASGTPVIISKQSGVSELIMHCLKVDFWDVKEMANKILGVLRYAPLKREMEMNSYAEISNINWDVIAEKTVKVYASVGV